MKHPCLCCGLTSIAFSFALLGAPLHGADLDHRFEALAVDAATTPPADKDQADEQKLDTKKLPAAVVASAVKAVPNGQVTGAESQDKNGKNIYDLEIAVGTQKYELKIGEDGTLLGQSEEIAVKDLPPSVAAGVKSALPDAVVTDAEKHLKDGKTQYELDVKSGGKNLEVNVGEDGKVLSQKEDDDKD